ncbi:thioredoxin family protein [Mangrovimonas aestuarii]|uniref:thioredoxin family protein n=1 Tax=Mangrovimonas aestuarii TaxID=3018443 RepID=UPI002378786D|nr:thioredoxin family protein [Mangrovimonas aestuarii]
MKITVKAILAVFLITLVSAFTSKENNYPEGYKVGDIVKDFTLANIDGSKVSLTDYNKTKGVIITFTCNTCPYAVAYEDRIIDLHNKFAAKGYPVLAINPNNPDVKPGDNLEAMKKRAQEKDFPFPYVVDEGQKVFPQFGATKTPHMFVLETTKKGHVVRYIGAIDNNYKDAALVTETYVEDAVNALLNGKTVEVEETKAIGCSIKV